MRIEVHRTGGFTGIERRARIDTTALPTAAADEWRALAARALGEHPPPGPARSVPDGFRYTVTVDGHTLHCADPGLTEAQRTLISRVLGEGA